MSSTNVQDAIDELYGVARLSERMDELDAKMDDYWKTVYPVGSIYISIKNTNPSTTFGGTWVEYGSGRTLIGAGTGTDSNSTSKSFTVNSTVGEYTHTLIVDEIPSHSHNISWDGNSNYRLMLKHASAITNATGINLGDGVVSTLEKGVFVRAEITGGSGAHNNLQPYITAYMWKRTA